IETGGMKTTGAMGASTLKFKIVHSEPPVMDAGTFNKYVEEAIRKSYAKYESMGFSLPQGTIRIVVVRFRGDDADLFGAVPREHPLRIELNFRLKTSDAIHYTVAHEYFHCIQYYNTNYISLVTFWSENWFLEGSADWAEDEVYDSIPGNYKAPTADRFRQSLNAIPSPNGGYDAVAFWKWVESQNPGTMWTILENQRLITSDERFSALGIPVKNMVLHSYEASLREVRPNVQFLSFFRSSLFYKDYEEDEDRVEGDHEDLWGPHKLGAPRELAPGLPEAGKTVILAKGEPGDNEDNPRSVDFDLSHHLTADVFVVKSAPGDNAVEGTLHVNFEPDARAPFEVAVIAYNGTNVVDETSVVVSGAQGASAEVPIDEITEVAVITVDPNWKDAGRGVSHCEVWVAEDSPCGDLPEPIVDIDNVEALIAALETPPASGTIRLAPGVYYPPKTLWDDVGDPQPDTRYANLMLDGVTLAGSGVEETRVIITGIDATPIFVRGSASLRDLTINGPSAWAGEIFYIANPRDFRMCNVVINDFTTAGNAIVYEAWDPGTFNLIIHDCTFYSHSTPTAGNIGIVFYPWRLGETGPTICLDLKKTEFYNWYVGVWFDNHDPDRHGTVELDTDCYFFSNVPFCHVLEMTGTDYIERCPSTRSVRR
ncbi:MAG: hypothetical protein P8181_07155, partial [bacterium]